MPSGALLVYVHEGGAPVYGRRLSSGRLSFFGRETRGLPEELILLNLDHAIRIPMSGGDTEPESL